MSDTTDTKIAVVETEVETLKKSDGDQWNAINEIRQYMRKLIPVWVTLVLMAMSAVTASALTFAGMAIRMVGK